MDMDLDEYIPYFGCCFQELYFSQNTRNRASIKKVRKNVIKKNIVPGDCFRTERSQDIGKILWTVKNFSILKLYADPIFVFKWGCEALILQGHHRLIACAMIGFNPTIDMSVYRC